MKLEQIIKKVEPKEREFIYALYSSYHKIAWDLLQNSPYCKKWRKHSTSEKYAQRKLTEYYLKHYKKVIKSEYKK